MAKKPERSGVNENVAIVDGFVDQDYLQLIEAAWAKVGGYAREILPQFEGQDSTDKTIVRALDWLREATLRKESPSFFADPKKAETTSLEVAREAYPGFLNGETTGTNLLFSGDGLEIWRDYYKSSNALYAPLNEIPAVALAKRVKEGVPFRVLEVGAGTGGATSVALQTIEQVATSPVNYIVTDISVRLLRSTAERLNKNTSTLIKTEFERFNLNAEPIGKLVAAKEFDVVIAVNALHNVQDLPATLKMLSTLLKKGGVLLISESLCGAEEQVHQEFFLNLLPQPEHRSDKSSRFLTSDEWQNAVRNAGLKAEIGINTSGPELVLLATVSKR